MVQIGSWFRLAIIQIPLEIALIHNYGNYTTIIIKLCMDQFFIWRYHGVKFVENWITFDPCPYIKFPLQFHVYAYKWLKNIGFVMKCGMKVYFVNLNHVTKFCYGWFIIAPMFKIGQLKKICLAITISLKIVLPRRNSKWTCLIWLWIILLEFIMIGS